MSNFKSKYFVKFTKFLPKWVSFFYSKIEIDPKYNQKSRFLDFVKKEKSCGCRKPSDEKTIEKALNKAIVLNGKVKTSTFAELFKEELSTVIRGYLRNATEDEKKDTNTLTWSKILRGILSFNFFHLNLKKKFEMNRWRCENEQQQEINPFK